MYLNKTNITTVLFLLFIAGTFFAFGVFEADAIGPNTATDATYVIGTDNTNNQYTHQWLGEGDGTIADKIEVFFTGNLNQLFICQYSINVETSTACGSNRNQDGMIYVGTPVSSSGLYQNYLSNFNKEFIGNMTFSTSTGILTFTPGKYYAIGFRESTSFGATTIHGSGVDVFSGGDFCQFANTGELISCSLPVADVYFEFSKEEKRM